LQEFSTSDQPLVLGTTFACDVLRRARQCIFIMRDCFSSFTVCKLLPNEQSETLRTALIETTALLKAPGGCIVRVDGAPGFTSLASDKYLTAAGIQLEIGRMKNRNKNPVGEKGVQELENELKRVHPDGSAVSESTLAQVTATLNSRIRNRGLSAKEIVFQRDNITGEQLHFLDDHLSKQQQVFRQNAHGPSARSQAKNGLPSRISSVEVGDIVFIKGDGDKHHSRERYLVVNKDKQFIFARKLAGTQYRSYVYKLKYSEVVVVPSFSTISHSERGYASGSDSDDSEIAIPRQVEDVPRSPTPSGPSIHSDSAGSDDNQSSPHVNNTRRSTRQHKIPAYLNDYVLDSRNT